jgi:tetratricopeptide (TPR) repeat protein
MENAISGWDKPLESKLDSLESSNERSVVPANLGGIDKDVVDSYHKDPEIQPDFPEVWWYNRGISLLYWGRYEEAIASFDKSLEFKPDDHEVWNIRGILLWTLGRLEEALTSFDRAIEFKPDFSEAWIYRGVALVAWGRLEEAIASYDKAIKIKPDFPEAWHNRGIALFYLERYQEAITSFNQTTQIKSDFPEAYHFRGAALSQLRRYEEALASYGEAIKIKPDFPEAWYDRGNALSDLRRYEEAITSYDKAIEFKPDYYQAWYNRGMALGNLGHLEEAITSYDKALEFRPDAYQPWNNQGNALKKLGRYEEALISFDKALEIKPDLQQAWYNKAACYALQGNVEQAIENLQQVINLNPDTYRELAKTDSDFDSIREDDRFQALIQEESEPEEGESKLLHNVSWKEFENILAAMSDNRSSRVAYDRGTLEIIMPTQTHEYYKEIISFLVQELADEMGKDCEPYGSTTWRRKAKEAGAEPDNSFYIQNESLVRGRVDIDLDQDPPPDLVLEIDYTSKSLDRMPIYARLGVPELWRYDNNTLSIYQLQAGKYNEADTSPTFGGFPARDIPSFIEQNISAGRRVLRQSFRAWVRQYLAETSQQSDWEDGEIDEREWLRAAASNPAFDFLKDPEEDIYTLADGKPFND